jgi:DNA processing protein
MENHQDLAWIKLNKAGLTPRMAKLLLDHFGSGELAVSAPIHEIAAIEGLDRRALEKLELAKDVDISTDLEKIRDLGLSVVTIQNEAYPVNLREIHDPPPVIYVKGTLKETDKFSISIVGTRRPSTAGRQTASNIARDLARGGFTIVSGMAYGIDSSAHQGAIAGGGRTVAVAGCGVDIVYPPANKDLYQEIADHGAVVSEFPIGTAPDAWQFPVRNRIISGLSLGTVVIEAPEKSGALLTAGAAADQGRDVYVVPGDVRTGLSKGCHALLKEGAKLIEGAEDILQEMGIPVEAAQERLSEIPEDISEDEKTVLATLSLEEKHIDSIILDSRLDTGRVNGILVTLEIRGLVKRVPGNCFVRVLR